MHFNTLHFEIDEGGLGPEGAGAPVEEPVEAPAAPEAPQPDFGSFSQTPEFQQAIGQAVYQTLGQLAEQSDRQPGEPETELDLYGDPGEFRQNLEGLIQREIQQAIAPILPTVEQMEVSNWQDRIEQITENMPIVKEIDQLLPEDTPPDHRAQIMVERMATAFLPEMRQIHGDGERALEGSLRAAADYILPIVKATHAAGYGARNAELGRLSGAREPAPSQGGPAEILDEPGNELEAAERFAARHGLR